MRMLLRSIVCEIEKGHGLFNKTVGALVVRQAQVRGHKDDHSILLADRHEPVVDARAEKRTPPELPALLQHDEKRVAIHDEVDTVKHILKHRQQRGLVLDYASRVEVAESRIQPEPIDVVVEEACILPSR